MTQGLALLAGVDPGRVDFVDSFYDGSPWVVGPQLTPDEHSRIAKLAGLWFSKPEHTCLRRAAPAHFITWAQAKGLPPQLLGAAQAAGFVSTQPAPTAATDAPEAPATADPRGMHMSSIKLEARRMQLELQGFIGPVIDQIIADEQLAAHRAAQATAPTPSTQSASRKRRVTAAEAQDEAIITKLVELGFKPLALPAPAKRGAHSPAKQAVRDSLNYTPGVIDHAWKRLMADQRIKYGDLIET